MTPNHGHVCLVFRWIRFRRGGQLGSPGSLRTVNKRVHLRICGLEFWAWDEGGVRVTQCAGFIYSRLAPDLLLLIFPPTGAPKKKQEKTRKNEKMKIMNKNEEKWKIQARKKQTKKTGEKKRKEGPKGYPPRRAQKLFFQTKSSEKS